MSQLIETPAEDTAIATGAQSTVVPIDNEPPPRLIVEPPLPGPLAQGVVFIPYRVENLRILPVAGPAARPAQCADRAGGCRRQPLYRTNGDVPLAGQGGSYMKLHKLTTALAFGLCILSALGYAESTEDRSIRPFKAQVPQAALEDLRRRIAATRWPEKETVADRSQGVQLAKLQELVRYWGTDYDWRKVAFILQRRRARAFAHQRRFPGRRHAVLADEQRHFIGATVLGNQRPKRSSRGRAEDRRNLTAGGHHGISGGGLSSSGNMGAARLSQPDLFQRSRQGRPLRRVGAARTLYGRTPCRLQIASTGTLITKRKST
jgi:Family of unknown function (DUF6130)/Epoxide hydrolase N terminus